MGRSWAAYSEPVMRSAGSPSPPRGYVPVLVGDDFDEDAAERFFVHVKLLKDPCIIELLEMAAEEFGYSQGVLRIACSIEQFLNTVEEICNEE